MAEGLRARLVVRRQLAPVNDLEAALLAVVRGEFHGVTLQRVTDLLGGRWAAEPGVPLPAPCWSAACAHWRPRSGWTGQPCSPCGAGPAARRGGGGAGGVKDRRR